MTSCVVLSHNSDRTLARTLESLAWCHETIVIDDGSTDTTVAIAHAFGAHVYTHLSNDDFAAQRNFGLSKATNEWVLFVDSDEIVTQMLAKEIQDVTGDSRNRGSFDSGNQDVAGYFIKRIDTMWGRELKYGETANVKLLRLAKKDSGKWERPVHETWNVKGELGELRHPLLHYPHPNVAQFIAKINRYSTLNAHYFYTKGVRTNIFQIVAYPAAKFFVNYVWRLGFLDGTPGALSAILMSFHSFLTRAKLYVHTSIK